MSYHGFERLNPQYHEEDPMASMRPLPPGNEDRRGQFVFSIAFIITVIAVIALASWGISLMLHGLK